jgi:hypothetical protein
VSYFTIETFHRKLGWPYKVEHKIEYVIVSFHLFQLLGRGQ